MNIRYGSVFSAVFLAILSFELIGAQEIKKTAPEAKPAETTSESARGGPQKIVKEGIVVQFTIEPVMGKERPAAVELMEGEDARVRFKVTDTATNTPVTGLNLSAWMNLRHAEKQKDKATEYKECREQIQSFMQGSLRARPDIDLNTYYVLALNTEANISVIDPLLGFGGSRLYTLVMLKSPGEDWVITSDQKKLFVTMPLINQVAVVDTTTWKVIANIDAGTRPTRIGLQPDEKYAWVTNDSLTADNKSGVTVIDAGEHKRIATIETGVGKHEMAFSQDNRYTFVTNKQDATVSIIDVQKLAKVNDVKVGAMPTSLVLSPLSNAIYVVSETEGSVTAVDSRSHQILTRMEAKPGLHQISFAPGGRWGFIANSKENLIHIFDASTNQLVQSVMVGKTPEQISFTKEFAYVRSAGTEEVSMIRLSTIGRELDVVKFPGGQLAPDKAASQSAAAAIVPTPEGKSVLIANPGDKMIYYYSEGMAAPMGNFQNYRREPRSVLVIDRSLRETTPGDYTATVKLPKKGIYDVAFLADSPRITHCFDAQAVPNPTLQQKDQIAVRIEHLLQDRKLRVGESTRLRFKLIDTATNQPKDGLKDVRVLTFLAPGVWQKRDFARGVGEGVYEVDITVPQSGVYMVFVECPSLRVTYNHLSRLILQATGSSASATK